MWRQQLSGAGVGGGESVCVEPEAQGDLGKRGRGKAGKLGTCSSKYWENEF